MKNQRRGGFCYYHYTAFIVAVKIPFRKKNTSFHYFLQYIPVVRSVVTLTTSFLERIVGLGTIICNTGDVTHPKLELTHIKNARAIKDFILQQLEDQRLKRRTLNTQNIGAMPDHDCEMHDDCGMPHMY